MASFCDISEDVVRKRATTVPDPYQPRQAGRPDWAHTTNVTVPCLQFAPASSTTTPGPDRAPVLTPAAFYGCDDAVDVLAGDRLVRADGSVWRVDGDPERWGSDGPDFPGGIVIHVDRVTEHPA